MPDATDRWCRAGRSRAGRLARLAWPALLALVAGTACAGDDGRAGPDPAARTTAGPVTAAAEDPRCGDAQPDRYAAPLFTPAPVQVVDLGGGRSADVHQPAADPASCRPALVWVHGGGFTTGTRNGPAEQAWGDALARRGYVWVSIDYDLAEGPQFGLADASGERADVVVRAIEQAREAVAWVRSHANDLRVDDARIALGGTSAGAMIALGAGLVAGPSSDAVCTIVAVAGDVRPEWVAEGSASVLFVHGDADRLVPFGSAERAAAALEDAGRTAALVPVPGAGHEIVGPPPPDVVDGVARWLGSHLARGCA